MRELYNGSVNWKSNDIWVCRIPVPKDNIIYYFPLLTRKKNNKVIVKIKEGELISKVSAKNDMILTTRKYWSETGIMGSVFNQVFSLGFGLILGVEG